MKNIRLYIYVLFLIVLAVLFPSLDADQMKIDGTRGVILGLIEDTEYAQDYTDKGFNQIEIGMTEEEVIHILGEPLTRWKPYLHTKFIDRKHYISLQYSDSPSDTHYRLRQVYLDNGIVAKKIGYFYID